MFPNPCSAGHQTLSFKESCQLSTASSFYPPLKQSIVQIIHRPRLMLNCSFPLIISAVVWHIATQHTRTPSLSCLFPSKHSTAEETVPQSLCVLIRSPSPSHTLSLTIITSPTVLKDSLTTKQQDALQMIRLELKLKLKHSVSIFPRDSLP